MKGLLRDLGWPAVCGVLFALLILQQFPQLVGLPAPASSYPSAQAIAPSGVIGVVSYSDAVSKAAPAVANIFTTKQIVNLANGSGLNGQILGDYGSPLPAPCPLPAGASPASARLSSCGKMATC
ncbi:hypothetical protein GCM10009083_01650 [Halopseudomonas pertucinogena]|uniref:Uncharacterized protein n=1 Tax=Halopseudomonas pertucinogena TaxID=86175 RepID=A0ABQ2CHZ0_9GAMM|nr:hypothetical protein GCM10009083_01650 [Halopseudomonas pertucinogena]